MAVAPLAIPTIITPWGVVAILFFMALAEGNQSMTLTVLGLLLLTMALNLAGLLLARRVVNTVGIPLFQPLGWILAVGQAALAVEVVLVALRHLGVATGATK